MRGMRYHTRYHCPGSTFSYRGARAGGAGHCKPGSLLLLLSSSRCRRMQRARRSSAGQQDGRRWPRRVGISGTA
eukprot:71848-Hanusia_phi.AAC.1